MNPRRFAGLGLVILGILASGLAVAAPVTLSYQVSPAFLDDGTGGGSGDRGFRYTYLLNGGLLAGQELDIEFDPSLFSRIQNPIVPSSLDVLLFQPNNPIGATGIFSALALRDVVGPATLVLEVFYVGGSAPGAQPFSVVTFNNVGAVVPLQDGTTVADVALPEPGALTCVGAAIAALAIWRLRQQRLS